MELKQRRCWMTAKSFATLTQEEQKYANIFLHDVQTAML